MDIKHVLKLLHFESYLEMDFLYLLGLGLDQRSEEHGPCPRASLAHSLFLLDAYCFGTIGKLKFKSNHQ